MKSTLKVLGEFHTRIRNVLFILIVRYNQNRNSSIIIEYFIESNLFLGLGSWCVGGWGEDEHNKVKPKPKRTALVGEHHFKVLNVYTLGS